MKYIMFLICVISLFGLFFMKYRVVLTGEKCQAKIVDVEDKRFGITISGVSVKKHAYIVEINHKKYYTAHGCLFVSLGKKNRQRNSCF